MTLDLASANASVHPSIRELTPSDIPKLRLGIWTRLSESDVERALEQYPGRSVWLPETLEFAIITPWRHRLEIANVQHLSAVRHPYEIVRDVVGRCDRHGAVLVLSVEIDESRRLAFYDRIGFELLEEIVTYELDCQTYQGGSESSLRFRAAEISRGDDLALLLELDHSAFPWLWWNSEQEFISYADTAGVEVLIGYHGDEPVSYLGLTAYLGWGHLDRIAVAPRYQGRGFGRESLAFAISRLMQTGARRIGLSTQKNNVRSQRLYERFGFRRAAENDYRLFGRILRMPDGVTSLTSLG